MTRTVAIVLRTKDRPDFLSRALDDVGQQTFRDFDVVVVNDGGPALKQDELLTAHPALANAGLIVVNNPASVGRPAACNVGLRASDSEFVVLHDDDDSWDPRFLEQTVSFLREPTNAAYAGVVAGSTVVHERVRDDGSLEQVGSERFAPDIEHVSVMELASHNAFPPIAYLYRRTLHDRVGEYDESLRVMADWDFNLRVVRHFDIGMLDENLAYWHLREGGAEAAANVSTASRQYEEDRARLLNSWLRRDLDDGGLGLGYLVNLMHARRGDVENAEEHWRDAIARLQALEAPASRQSEEHAAVRDGILGSVAALSQSVEALAQSVDETRRTVHAINGAAQATRADVEALHGRVDALASQRISARLMRLVRRGR
jgi:glycosyltransferase involved in cell wall biosynthesis